METDKKKEEDVVIQKEEKTTQVKKSSSVIVKSNHNIDFPSLDWGINKGEERELPVDEQAQKIILASEHISIIK